MVNETSASTPNELEAKVIKQVEYYFGDVNLPRDKILQEEMKKNDGWVSIEKLLTFNRLKALTPDISAISAALRKSTTFIDVSEDNVKVRRNPEHPLPENRLDFWKQTKTRTIYVKGFPLDITLDDLMAFFTQHGQVINILMRRNRDSEKTFKGSVFVTYETRDVCSKFLALESLKYKESELLKMFENDYYTMKTEQRRQQKSEAKTQKNAAKDHLQKKQQQEPKELAFKKGVVLYFTGIAKDSGLTREKIKEAIQAHGQIDWIDFVKGDEEAYVRMAGEENCGAEVLGKLLASQNDMKVELAENVKSECRVLMDQDEKEYWERNQKARQDAFNKKRNARKGGGKGFKGKQQRFDRNREKAERSENEGAKKSGAAKRQAGASAEEPEKKTAKVE